MCPCKFTINHLLKHTQLSHIFENGWVKNYHVGDFLKRLKTWQLPHDSLEYTLYHWSFAIDTMKILWDNLCQKFLLIWHYFISTYITEKETYKWTLCQILQINQLYEFENNLEMLIWGYKHDKDGQSVWYQKYIVHKI